MYSIKNESHIAQEFFKRQIFFQFENFKLITTSKYDRNLSTHTSKHLHIQVHMNNENKMSMLNLSSRIFSDDQNFRSNNK